MPSGMEEVSGVEWCSAVHVWGPAVDATLSLSECRPQSAEGLQRLVQVHSHSPMSTVCVSSLAIPSCGECETCRGECENVNREIRVRSQCMR